MDLNPHTVGIVVPTLGKRIEFLGKTLQSIKQSTNVFTLVVCPAESDLKQFENLIDARIDDPKSGLSEAINLGISKLPNPIELVNWLGDDDFLEPNAIDLVRKFMNADSKIVAAFGKCAYVDSNSEEIFINNSGQWAVPLLNFGPNLVPQPGMLFKKSAFLKSGALNNGYSLAFDLDLLLKFKKIGKIKYLNERVANFRWHADSLTVDQRINSVKEASSIRISYLPYYLKPFSYIWEAPVKYITLTIGQRLTRHLQGN